MRSTREKIKTFEELAPILSRTRAAGRKIVFTNGCFDLLHVGHVRCLEEARRAGDVLVVAINGDQSVRLLKGEGRPILPATERSELVAALQCVDWIVVFEEETPLDLIKAIAPDILAKGGDYALNQIVGRKEVEAAGGKVIAIQFEEGSSTTQLIDRIRSSR